MDTRLKICKYVLAVKVKILKEAEAHERELSKAYKVELKEETAEKNYADEHVIGVAQGLDEEVVKGLRENFMGECSEVGMYLAMSRQADREGYPEIAEAFKDMLLKKQSMLLNLQNY